MSLFDSGNFSVGCNYWASHAGTAMWRDWRPQVVERDFTLLESLKLDVVRVFPLWTEFQPLQLFSIGNNTPYQLRWKDGGPIPHEADGSQSGVDPEMLERFRFLCDCAQRHHLNLGVGLITGWMSGRLFTPPAFAQGKLLTDPMVLQWQLRFVHRFVREFRDHPAIAFWGVGNECNNLEKTNRHQGALWCRLIADAIRAEDPGHPLVAKAEELGLSFLCGNSHALEIFENGVPLAYALRNHLPECEVVIFRERQTSIPLDEVGSPEIRAYGSRIAGEYLHRK